MKTEESGQQPHKNDRLVQEEQQQHLKDPELGLEQTHAQQPREPEEKQQEEQETEQEKHPFSSSQPTITMYPSSPPLTPLSPPLGPTSPPLTTLSAPYRSPPDSTRFSTDHSLDHTDSHVFSPEQERPPSPSPMPVPLPTHSVEADKARSNPRDGVDVRYVEEVDGGVGAGNYRRRMRPNLTALRKAKRESIMKKVSLGSRIFAFVFCLISFSVMAADKDQGWALDSFHWYKEFRYCMTMNVLGFVYSALQAYDLAYTLTTGKYIARNQLRYALDFFLDQILAYLLLSASSSAVFRVEDWESNWGKDKFPTMARASVALSFLAFVAFASSSLISGLTFFTPGSS